MILLLLGEPSLVEALGLGLQADTALRLGVSSSSSMVAKWRLTSTVLVSGHRCSAGCSSGEYGGRKSKWTWSGTRRRCVLCQPARSSTSTICLRGEAPTAGAKAASSASKSGILTEVAR